MDLTTTSERVETLRRYIVERRRLSNDLRARAIGDTEDNARRALKDADVCDAVAAGMERALAILFP